MDYDATPTPINKKDHLNAKRPQDAALNPGARTPTNKGTTPAKTTQNPTPAASGSAGSTKLRINQVEIKALKSKPPSNLVHFGPKKIGGAQGGSDIKPSVSITPISSADAISDNVKKPVGIEIIPLGDKLPSKFHAKNLPIIFADCFMKERLVNISIIF